MNTFISRRKNISRQMSSLLNRMSTLGFEATPSPDLLEQTSLSCNVPVTKEANKSPVERGYFADIKVLTTHPVALNGSAITTRRITQQTSLFVFFFFVFPVYSLSSHLSNVSN